MNVWRAKSGLFLIPVLLATAAGFASIPAQRASLLPEFPPLDTTEDADFDPAAIPTSAVAKSENCSTLATIEEQLEHGIVGGNLSRIQGPEQHPPLAPSGKLRLAIANLSDPFSVTITALDSEFGNAAG